jgi:hypothetical protein
MTPFKTDRPSAHAPSTGRNSHIPYGLYICIDGSQVLHDRNYVPTHWRAGDGHLAEPVPLLPDGRGRWCSHDKQGYFFVGGSHPIGRRANSKSVKAAIVRGETILERFITGQPVWAYLANADVGVCTGWL